MSQYNKTVLTRAGLELAKRANAGQAKFGITRAVASADDWSHKTVQDLEEVTTIPNIMQQGTIMDTDEVESNNSVIGVSLCFTNKNLSTGYQIKVIGLYVKEEGQENDFLYAVTTAISPEYMPSFADKVLYRFNMQMYLVIGNAQSVNVVINDGTAVTHGQLDKYKAEVTGNLKKLENTHKEDMSHVAKSASINGGAEILPDSTGKLNLVVPDPDLSEYVSLEQLTETLQAKADVADVNKQIKAVTDLANTKANSADVYTKTETDNQINKFDLSKVKFHKQYINSDGQAADKTWSATKNEDGTYTIDLYNDDWTASKLNDVIKNQLPSKANTTDVNNALNGKANAGDVSALQNKVNVNTPLFREISADSTWEDIFGVTNPTNVLTSLRINPGGNDQLVNDYAAGIGFGGNDTKAVISVDYGSHVARFTAGNGTSPDWSEDVAWKSDISNLQNIINQQNQTIQSLTTRLANAENEINYIKDNYVEGRRFPASQEAQAEAWENENPQRIAFITK